MNRHLADAALAGTRFQPSLWRSGGAPRRRTGGCRNPNDDRPRTPCRAVPPCRHPTATPCAAADEQPGRNASVSRSNAVYSSSRNFPNQGRTRCVAPRRLQSGRRVLTGLPLCLALFRRFWRTSPTLKMSCLDRKRWRIRRRESDALAGIAAFAGRSRMRQPVLACNTNYFRIVALASIDEWDWSWPSGADCGAA